MLDNVPASGSFLELATQLQPGTGPCLDADGKIQNGCFVVAYIVYMLMHGFVSLKQSEHMRPTPLPSSLQGTRRTHPHACSLSNSARRAKGDRQPAASRGDHGHGAAHGGRVHILVAATALVGAAAHVDERTAALAERR